MNNAALFIKNDMQRHQVSVTLPGEHEEKSLCLVMIEAKTSMVEDLKSTYGDDVTPLHMKIAKKIFGEGETANVYGVFVDKNLQMVFAFNRAFADYVGSKKAIVYRDIDDLLAEKIQPGPLKELPVEKAMPRFPSGGSGPRGVVKYSLAEKAA